MNNAQVLATKLQNAMESNQRIQNSKREIVYHQNEITSLEETAKGLLMQSIKKQMRCDDLAKELENAVEIDIDAIQKEIAELA